MILLWKIHQSIFYEIQRLENSAIANEQWVWELLQNALDAICPDKSVKVQISWDGETLAFRHNGDAFDPNEISHLIYHGTTKYRDSKKRGKFGRGFLVTHLLSKRVEVRGIEHEQKGNFVFKIDLNRDGDIAAIRQQMEIPWDQLLHSRQPLDLMSKEISLYSTEYSYKTDRKGKETANSGIKAAKRCFPYVLASIPELEEISIIEQGIKTTFHKQQASNDSSFPTIHLTPITLVVDDQATKKDENETTEHLIVAESEYKSSESQDILSVALTLRGKEICELASIELVPRLFVMGLPVVSTEDLPIPVIVLSPLFEPKADRMGLYAEKTETTAQLKNWSLLAKVATACIPLMKYASTQKWGNLKQLACLAQCPNKEWLDSTKLTTTIIKPLIQEIQNDSEIRIVTNINGENIPISQAWIPIDDEEGLLFDLLTEWEPAANGLVNKSFCSFWSARLGDWGHILSQNTNDILAASSIESLAKQVSSCENLDTLKTKVKRAEDQGHVNWLNKFIELIIKSKNKALLITQALLPDQKGKLHKLNELFYDSGIDEILKDISELGGISVRSTLLLRQVTGIQEQLQRKEETELLVTLLDKASELQVEVNAKLLAWLAARKKYSKYLNGYPVVTQGNAQKLDSNRPLLKPVGKWASGSTNYSDLFPKDYILDVAYASHLTDDNWKILESSYLICSSLIYRRPERDIEQCVLEDPLVEINEQNKHELQAEVNINGLYYLEEKDKGVIDAVRHSRPKATMFISFLFRYLAHADSSWNEPVPVNCSCGKEHKLIPCGWIAPLKERQWVPLGGKKYGYFNADNIVSLVEPQFLDEIARDDSCVALLQRLGVGISDLFRIKIPDPKDRLAADRLAARMYAVDAESRALLSAVLDDPGTQEIARQHLEQKRITERNRKVGAQLEQLVKTALESEHITVLRTGIGSDYEVEYDFIENGQEQALIIGKYLLEIKSTSTGDVRMTLAQGNKAVNLSSEYNGYILSVCQLSSDNICEDDVKTNRDSCSRLVPI